MSNSHRDALKLSFTPFAEVSWGNPELSSLQKIPLIPLSAQKLSLGGEKGGGKKAQSPQDTSAKPADLTTEKENCT